MASTATARDVLGRLGRVENGFAAPPADFSGHMETLDSGFGRLAAFRHAARLSGTPATYARPSVPPGTDPLDWNRPDGIA